MVAMLASTAAWHVRCPVASSSAAARAPSTMLSARKNAPSAHHSVKCSAMTAVWMPSAPSRQAAATAIAPAGVAVGREYCASMSDDLELGHHVVVFVLDVVAVENVGAAEVDELQGDANGLVGAERDDVLGAGLVGLRRSSVAVEHAELDEVRMDRVQPAAGLVDEPPDLGAAELRERI